MDEVEEEMTIKELKQVTKCHIYIEWTDSDGAARRAEWTHGGKDYQIDNIKIIHANTPEFIGFALAVELVEGSR